MRYLVCRTEAIRPSGRLRSSECFPAVVDAVNKEDAVYRAIGISKDQYRPGGVRNYIVVLLEECDIVSFRPREQYDVDIRPYRPGMDI